MTDARTKKASLVFGSIIALSGGLALLLLSRLGLLPEGSAVGLAVLLGILTGLMHYWKTLQIQTMRDEFSQVKRRLSHLDAQVAEAQGLIQLSGLEQPFPMPFGGTWALTPDAAVILAREVVTRKPGVVVELGSGVSTILVGRLLKQLGHGRLISLDHDLEWAQLTRKYVHANGLQDIVQVLDAPLELQNFDGRDYRWYRLPEELRDVNRIDMVTVDGPPQIEDTSVLSRYPAMPAFEHKLSDNAVFYIDDAGRETEKNMVSAWMSSRTGWTSRMFDTVPGTCILERKPQDG